jgi:hypothetical protein
LVDEIALTCGGWLQGVAARPVHIDRSSSLRPVLVGIYLATDIDLCLDYIGSVTRQGSRGMAGRLLDHPTCRRGRWRWIWPIVLSPDTPLATVQAIEGHAIDMYRPPGNRRRKAWRPLPIHEAIVYEEGVDTMPPAGDSRHAGRSSADDQHGPARRTR